MVQNYVAYIDEAGDEGFGKLRQEFVTGQSKWLALGAAINAAPNDRFAAAWRDEVIALFPQKKRRDLHFRTLSHEQRVAACMRLAEKRIGICVVASNKETILDSGKLHVFKQKGYLYNYLVRYLLERVTDACQRAAATKQDTARLRVVFSRRGGTDYQIMHDYLCLMRDGREVKQPTRSINWDVLDPEDIRVENHSIRAGLQIADVLTSATCCAFEPNGFGFCEPRYALTLKRRYIRHNGQIMNCGITVLPPPHKNPLNDAHKQFLDDIEK